jgi:tetratricopeptide (TPR) repeat protein
MAAGLALALGAASAPAMTPTRTATPKGMGGLGGLPISFSDIAMRLAQAPPPAPPRQQEDPWGGVLYNTRDPWLPGAVPPRGVRRPGVQPPMAPVAPLAAGEKPKPDRLQSLYRQALVHWAAGDSDQACSELATLETSVVKDADPSSARRLLRSEEKVIDEVAGHDLEVLVPIARLHFEVFRRYVNENAKGHALVENHSRTMVHDLAMLYREQSGSEGAALVASHLLTTLAELLQRGSQHQAAAALYTQAAELDRRNVLPALRLAVTYEKFEQYQSAAGWLRKVLAIEPAHSEARLRLAVNLGRLKKTAEAEKLLRELTADEGESWVTPLAFQELARLEERREALGKAEEVLRAGAARYPQSVRMRVQLAAVLDRRGKIREARSVIEEIPTLQPGPEEEARFRYNSSGGDSVAASLTFFEENASARMRVLAEALATTSAPPAEAATRPPGERLP